MKEKLDQKTPKDLFNQLAKIVLLWPSLLDMIFTQMGMALGCDIKTDKYCNNKSYWK